MTTLGKMPVEILKQDENKVLAKRLDTIDPVYEIFKISPNGNKEFHKTHKNLTKITNYYDSL